MLDLRLSIINQLFNTGTNPNGSNPTSPAYLPVRNLGRRKKGIEAEYFPRVVGGVARAAVGFVIVYSI
jgi:hypothetical protein